MAQTIRCDYTECPELADVIVSNLENGETVAWCGPHYIEAAIAIADSVASAEADQAAAGAERALEAAGQAPALEDAELDAAAIEARIGGPAATEATEDATPDDDARDIMVQGIGMVPSTSVAHTVRRGQSAKAQAHQARQDAAQDMGNDPDGDLDELERIEAIAGATNLEEATPAP